MKKSILYILISLFSLSGLFSQDMYTKGMQKAFGLWGEQKSQEAIALFERISQAEKDNWIPTYYAANVLIVSSFQSQDKTMTNEMLEKAKVHIAEAHNRSADNSEILTLEGLLYTAYVAMDPQTYAMQYSQKIMELHAKAVELDPKNPRAQSNQIEYEMGAARFFNQPLAPFCERLAKVLPLYDAQDNETPFYPDYGKDRLQETIDNCGK